MWRDFAAIKSPTAAINFAVIRASSFSIFLVVVAAAFCPTSHHFVHNSDSRDFEVASCLKVKEGDAKFFRSSRLQSLEAAKCGGHERDIKEKVNTGLTRRQIMRHVSEVASGFLMWDAPHIDNRAVAHPEYGPNNDMESEYGIIDKNQLDANNKVVLRTSTKNTPKSYVDLTTTPSTTSSESFDSSMCTYIDSETRRIEVFERSAPSVVFIDTFTAQRDAFSTNIMEVPLGAGSGFVWDDRGHIVTNYHVVRNAKSAQVAILTRLFKTDQEVSKRTQVHSPALNYGRKKGSSGIVNPVPDSSASVTDYTRKVYKATVVGSDPDKDIAVLKIDAPVYDLHPIDVGTSQNIKVGQSALAIGNPFGLDHTLTVGVISGTGREVRSPSGRPISNTIQSDAAINPGNSGGPLLDSAGKLIGMNTAIYSPSGGSAGISFAIPVDTLRVVVDTLIRDGRVVRPIIGISYLESKQAKALGITKGVLILDVPSSSPAYKAGLRGTRRTESGLIEIGDIIIKIENRLIDTEADLFEALESFQPGDRIKITVNRVEFSGSDTQKPKMKEVTITTQLKGNSDEAHMNKYWSE